MIDIDYWPRQQAKHAFTKKIGLTDDYRMHSYMTRSSSFRHVIIENISTLHNPFRSPPHFSFTKSITAGTHHTIVHLSVQIERCHTRFGGTGNQVMEWHASNDIWIEFLTSILTTCRYPNILETSTIAYFSLPAHDRMYSNYI